MSETGRTATEKKLEAAALRLLQRDGVLSGLNLQEVADEAGINRALVYRYFGSRRELLRKAYYRSAERTRPDFETHMNRPFRERYRWMAHGLIEGQSAWARIVSLLALDGDEEFEAMEYADATIGALRRDRDNGVLPGDTDVEATHAFWFCATAGYATLRKQVARELDIPQAELDERVINVIARLVDLMSSETKARSRSQRPAS